MFKKNPVVKEKMTPDGNVDLDKAIKSTRYGN